MCETIVASDDLVVVHQARLAAEAVLERCFRIPVRKALDLGSAAGFDRAVAQLAARLRARTSSSDLAAVKAAVAVLDIDWKTSTAGQRRTLISQALAAAGRQTTRVPQDIQAVFGPAATEVVRAARHDVRAGQGLAIGADFNAVDRRIIEHLRSSQANYVRDEYGRRNEAFGEQARRIVADGLERGLGRDDIARQLEEAARSTLTGRGGLYWDVVAGSFVGRGRSFGQLSSYAEAGLERFRIEAVLDENTTDICRFLTGKTFSVSAGLDLLARGEADPDALKQINPWVREARDGQGRMVMFVEREGGGRARLGVVERSGVGQRDDRGEFSGGLSAARVQALGVSFPPYHALCRSTTVADVSARLVTPRVAEAVPEPERPRTDGPAELLAASETLRSTSGQALPLDAGSVENFDVQFRVEKIDGREVTKVRFKVTSNHAEQVERAILAGDAVNRSDAYRHRKGGPDPRTGGIVKGSEEGGMRFKAVSASFGTARVRMVTERGALKNFVEIDIPTNNASEAFRAYAEAARRMGITDAGSFPSAEALDTLRQARLITMYDRKGWEKLQRLSELSPETVGPLYRESLQRFPELAKVAEDATLVQTARGHVALYSKSQAERLRKDGVIGLTHDLSDARTLVHILGDRDGTGMMSSTQRYHRGIFVNGMSTATDFGTGGADSVFLRVVVKGQRRSGTAGARVLIDPDQLGRLDWYFFNFDNYGRAGPNDFAQRKLVPEMKDTFRQLSSGNEAMLQHGVPIEAIRGVVISDPSTRQQTLRQLREAGIREVNRKPIEEFVTTRENF